MQIRTADEARENIENFSKEYLKLVMQKKSIDEEIKEMRNNYKEDGVPVGKVTKVLNKIKANKKKSDTEQTEENIIEEWLENNKEIDDMLTTLIAK